MPKHFTPEELARSAAAGEPRLDTDLPWSTKVNLYRIALG